MIEGKQIYICMKGGNYERIIDLMIISKNNRKHYVAIKSLSRLLASENTNHKGKEYICMNCLQGFKEESSRNEHIDYCIDNESVKVEMPRNNPRVQYSDGQFQFKVPFIMYADFESILELIQGPGNDPIIPSTRAANNHVPSGWFRERLKILYNYIEVRIALRTFVIMQIQEIGKVSHLL